MHHEKKVLYLYIRKKKLSFEALNTPKGAHSKLGIDKKQSDESVNKDQNFFVCLILVNIIWSLKKIMLRAVSSLKPDWWITFPQNTCLSDSIISIYIFCINF